MNAPTEHRFKKRHRISNAIAHISTSSNNTIVTITDSRGATICASSGGTVGFKGARKSTAYAAQLAGEDAAKKAVERGVGALSVKLRGMGVGREAALRALREKVDIAMIQDCSRIPFAGCRPPKRRRT